MAATIGRKLLLKKNSVVLLGLRNVSISDGNESINVTSGEDDGLRLLLSETAEQGLDISFDGIAKDRILDEIAFDPSADRMLTDIEIEFPISNPANATPATITGNFRLGTFEKTHPYSEATTFSSTLESSGPWVYTAEAV